LTGEIGEAGPSQLGLLRGKIKWKIEQSRGGFERKLREKPNQAMDCNIPSVEDLLH
jgi:hypothetical protein